MNWNDFLDTYTGFGYNENKKNENTGDEGWTFLAF